MKLLWPTASASSLDDADLTALYRSTDRARPRLRVNFVTSLDGAVTVDGDSAGLSSGADKRVFGILRMLCDALLVGAGTLRIERYGPLDAGPRRRALRRAEGLADDPTLVILSQRLALDPTDPVFTDAPVRPIILTHAGSSARRRELLAPAADVIVAGDTAVDLDAALGELHARGLSQVLCEGGPHTLGALTAADKVDELCLTVAPLLAGAGPGRLSAGEPTDVPRHLTLRHILAADDTLMLRYARPERASARPRRGALRN